MLPDLSDWEKTSLKPYVEMFDRHAQTVMGDMRKVKREQGEWNMSISHVSRNLTRLNPS